MRLITYNMLCVHDMVTWHGNMVYLFLIHRGPINHPIHIHVPPGNNDIHIVDKMVFKAW